MWTAEEFAEIYKRLRNGEDVKCQLCNNGMLIPVGADCNNTNCFECSHCKEKLIFD
jgi:hypothetical protein